MKEHKHLINSLPKEKAAILLELRAKAEELGGTPTVRDDNSLTYRAKKHFDTFNRALKLAGLELNRHPKWTKETMIEELRKRAKKLDKVTSNTCSDLVMPAGRLFDTWNKAKEEAGLETYERGEMPFKTLAEKAIEVIEDREVISKEELLTLIDCSYNSITSLNRRLTENNINKVCLNSRGGRHGSIKYTLSDYLIPSTPNTIYYNNKEKLAKVIEDNLKRELTKQLPQGYKRSLTSFLKKKLPEETFNILHSKYIK